MRISLGRPTNSILASARPTPPFVPAKIEPCPSGSRRPEEAGLWKWRLLAPPSTKIRQALSGARALTSRQ